MESNSNSKSGLLTAGGVLSIVAGIVQITCGGVLIWNYIYIVGRFPCAHHSWLVEALFLPFIPTFLKKSILEGFSLYGLEEGLFWWLVNGVPVGALGILALIGGISATRRKSYILSLVGAISAIPSTILGILAIIFVAVGKREFRVR